MIVKIDTSFEKDTNKIQDKRLLIKIALIIENCIAAQSLSEIKQCKKLSGYKNYYRIRMGDYRLGIRLENEELIIERVLHRKDIYKFFP